MKPPAIGDLSAHERVMALLQARRWAVAALAGDAARSDIPTLRDDSWRLFFALERCAAVLLSRMPVSAVFPPGLRNAAATESQSSLQARAEGRIVSDIASRLDFPIVVLKGGVRAIGGVTPSLPLADIDLLVPPQHVATLTAKLRDAGFGKPVRATSHHQGIDPAEGRLAMEVHWTTNDDGRPVDPGIWQRLRPIAGVEHLMQLSARDTLEHLLRHAIVVHRDRSASLRDVALIGYTALDCSDADLEEARAAMLAERQSAKLLQLLDFALALAMRSLPVRDPFVDEAATFYSAVAVESRITSPAARAFMLEIALGRSTAVEAARRALKFRGSGHASLQRIASRFPRAGPVIAGAAHTAYYTAVTTVSLPLVRRTASQALQALARQTR